MHTFHSMRMAGLATLCATAFAAPGLHAQSLDPAPVPAAPAGLAAPVAPATPVVLVAPPAATFGGVAGQPQPFAKVQPVQRGYMANTADSEGNAVMNSNKAALGVWVTDPRPVAGYNLTPNLAVETGVVNLYDRGTHYVDNSRPENVAGAFGAGGYNSYLAGKLTLPVSERLQAYGKAGLAHSEIDYRDEHLRAVSETDGGSYVGVGARYKLSEKASVSGGYERYGDSQKWGGATNNNGVSAKLKLGF